MFSLKKDYTNIAASTIALSTSARFKRSKIEVARTAISVFLTILTLVPNYRATAVTIALVRSHNKVCPLATKLVANLYLANCIYLAFALRTTYLPTPYTLISCAPSILSLKTFTN
jgi:hypothetical protein